MDNIENNNEEVQPTPPPGKGVVGLVSNAIRTLEQKGLLQYGGVILLHEIEEALGCLETDINRWLKLYIEWCHQMEERGMFVKRRQGLQFHDILSAGDNSDHVLGKARGHLKRRTRGLRGLAATPRDNLTEREKAKFDFAEQKLSVMILQDRSVIYRRSNFPKPAGGGENPYK